MPHGRRFYDNLVVIFGVKILKVTKKSLIIRSVLSQITSVKNKQSYHSIFVQHICTCDTINKGLLHTDEKSYSCEQV